VGLGQPAYGWGRSAPLSVLWLRLCSGVFLRLLESSSSDACSVCIDRHVMMGFSPYSFLFSCLIPVKHRFTKTRGTLSV
jgi:hypothetical protein